MHSGSGKIISTIVECRDCGRPIDEEGVYWHLRLCRECRKNKPEEEKSRRNDGFPRPNYGHIRGE